MTETPKVVAITGASGYIGTRLLQRLEENRSVKELVSFDIKPLLFPIYNITVYRWDVVQPIDDKLRRHQVDTLVHLAGPSRYVPSLREQRQFFRQNLDALNGTLNSCVKAGVRHVIYVSSHQVYGAFPDNPAPLSELAVARCDENAPFGYANLESDLAVQDFAERRPEIKVTILRACTVLGTSDRAEQADRIFPLRFWGVGGGNPPFQFLHEADLTRIMEDIIQRGTPGVFNVAGEGVVFLQELAELTHRRLIQLPSFLAYPAAWLFGKLLSSGSGAAELDAARYPIIMSSGKIKQTLGYRFNHTSMEALMAFVNYTGM